MLTTTGVDVDALVARAVAAQQAFEDWPEASVDALLKDVAQSHRRQFGGAGRRDRR